jgi:hypothetical protein
MVVRGLAGIGTEFGAKTELRLIERSRGRVASPAVPVEFLSEGQVARFGQFAADPSPVELERFFRLDGDAWRLVGVSVVMRTGWGSRCSGARCRMVRPPRRGRDGLCRHRAFSALLVGVAAGSGALASGA